MRSFDLSRFLFFALIVATAASFRPTHCLADEEGAGGVGIPVHGFASGGWGYDDSKGGTGLAPRGFSRGFAIESLDLYLNPDLGGRVRFLAEVVAESNFYTEAIGVDTERLQMGYVFSNNLVAWVGRFHTPIGFWVISAHHGAQLQTAVDRPRFLDWEDHYGVLPVHTTGLWLTGQTFIGTSRLAYMAWAGNGSRMNTDMGQNLNGTAGFTNLDMQMGHDDNNDTAAGFRLAFFPGFIDGFQVGFSALREQIDSDPGNNNPNTSAANTNTSLNGINNFSSVLNLAGVHAVYEAHGFELLTEGYYFQNSFKEDAAGKKYASYASYAQLAYWFDSTYAPYVRVEKCDFDVNDPYFFGQSNGLPYSKAAAGFRYNLDENSALKIEFSQTKILNTSPTMLSGNINLVRTQYAVRF